MQKASAKSLQGKFVYWLREQVCNLIVGTNIFQMKCAILDQVSDMVVLDFNMLVLGAYLIAYGKRHGCGVVNVNLGGRKAAQLMTLGNIEKLEEEAADPLQAFRTS